MYIFSLILGTLIKIVDDIVDRPILVGALTQHVLQSVIILFFTLITSSDFYFSYASLLVLSFNPGMEHPFWKSLLPVAIILLILTSQYRGNYMIIKLFLCTIGVGGLLLFTHTEDICFPEETSSRKMVSRVGIVVCLLLSTLVIPYFPLPLFSIAPLQKTIGISIGYLMISIIHQSYDLVTVTMGAEAVLEADAAVRGRAIGLRTEGLEAEAEAVEEERGAATRTPVATIQARRIS